MTGPEHYREAEKLLATLPTSVAGGAFERALLDEAQVHATLALAAATALKDPESAGFYKVDRLEWEKAASRFESPEADL